MKGLNVLIADDNKSFVEAFKFILSNIEDDLINKIYSAYNGEECLDIVKKEKIDVIFMDVDMPDMNGIQATKKITEINRFIKIIAISFHNEMDYVHKMINAGAINYVRKENLNVNTIVKELRATTKA